MENKIKDVCVVYGLKIYSRGEVVLECWHSTMAGILALLNEHESELREDGVPIDKMLLSYEGAV